jgi:hypothetical protein
VGRQHRRVTGGRRIAALLTGAAPRVLLVAPFGRGLAHGGSLRATAMAERLEARGARVRWLEVPVEHGGRAAKVKSLVRGEPALVRTHTARVPAEIDGRYDVAIASHSYLADALDGVRARRRVIDFHNLEWRVLAGTACASGGLRGEYLSAQAALMRRYERALLAREALVTMATAQERAWVVEHGARDALVVPNLLSAAAVEEAERAAAVRSGRGPLVYVGTLTFPPNVRALLQFLERCWPAVHAAHPDAELHVAGRCSPSVGAAISAHPGVRALGFVEDLPAMLGGAAAALLPFDGRGGSSLRCLQYALARVPVVAAPAAVRGLPFSMGLIASTPGEWAAAVSACRAGQADVDGAEQGARALQDDDGPWDALWEALELPVGVLA